MSKLTFNDLDEETKKVLSMCPFDVQEIYLEFLQKLDEGIVPDDEREFDLNDLDEETRMHLLNVPDDVAQIYLRNLIEK